MNEVERAKIVLKILNKTYPTTPIPLKHRNIFTLLISVLLSAQCTDVNVNNVTKNIYPKYNKPCLLYTSPSPRDLDLSRMPSSA